MFCFVLKVKKNGQLFDPLLFLFREGHFNKKGASWSFLALIGPKKREICRPHLDYWDLFQLTFLLSNDQMQLPAEGQFFQKLYLLNYCSDNFENFYKYSPSPLPTAVALFIFQVKPFKRNEFKCNGSYL